MKNSPRVEINISKLKYNLTTLTKKLQKNNISVAAVTKVFCAYHELVEVYNSIPYIQYLADSRISNIKGYPKNITKEKMLLRIPMLSEVKELVEYVDISLNSEIGTIEAISKVAEGMKKLHRIILMIDLGDLREGIFDEAEIIESVEKILQLPNIQLAGLGTNLTCYGGIIPTGEVLQKLVSIHRTIEEKYNISLPILSGGNSSSLYLLDNNQETIPEEINMLRIGEAFVLGRETAYGNSIEGMYQDVFILKTEIIEYKDKPSYPIGPIGMNAFGEKPEYEDKGMMKRGIVAIGKQDVDHRDLIPVDDRIEIIGSSSDHMIIDFTNAADDYYLGAEVSFNVNYGSLLSVFTSKYVYKTII